MPASSVNASVAFSVRQVSHLTRSPTARESVAACNSNIYDDVGCSLEDWGYVSRSVAMLDYVVPGGDSEQCTGTLLQDHDGFLTRVPYILTANHCIDTPGKASTINSHWNWYGCGINVPPPPEQALSS